MNHDVVNPPPPHIRVEVGEKLRSKREKVGMSVEELAGRLNLRTSFIQAVEEGRGGQHMDWAYERIHLRSMTRILDLDFDSMIGGSYRDSHEGV